MKRLLFGPRIIVIAGAILLISSAMAQRGVGIAPPRLDIIADTPSIVTETIDVFSQNAPDQLISIDVTDWFIDPSGTVREIPPGANPYSASPWLHINKDPFNLASNSVHKIKFSIDIPASDRLEGSYWTAISFTTEPRPAKDARGITISLKTRVLAIIYVTIQGTERPASELQGVSIEAGDDGKQYVVADVVNKGNVYLRLNGELRFLNTKGEVVKQLPLPERVLLRDGLIRYRLPLPDDLPDDALLAAIEIQPQGPAKSYGGPPLYGETSLK